MRDVTEQLAAYFDATVERVTADDVLAGSDVRSQNGRPAPARVPRLRPAWVVAAGFVATIVLVGGAVGIVRLMEGDSAGVGTSPSPVGDTGDGLSGPWALLIAAGVILVLAVVGLVWRNRIETVKEQTMQTIEKPEVEVSPRPRSPAILILLAALLVVAAGALGWWIGSSGDDVGDVPEIVEAVNQAWVDGDADAVAALYTEDAVFEQIDVSILGRGGERVVTGRSGVWAIASSGMSADFEELTADYVTVLEDVIIYQWTNSGTVSGTPFESTGVTILEIEDGLIAESRLYFNGKEIYSGQSSS
jgi:ketosteroid isomerase-like protein